jgi:hypothetical protein
MSPRASSSSFVPEFSKSHKSLIYVTLIFGVLVFTFVQSIQVGMHRTVPEAIGRNQMSIGIAISEMTHGLTGYRGYNKVLKTLSDQGMTRIQ